MKRWVRFIFLLLVGLTGFGSNGLVSPFAPEAAYNAYGGSVERLEQRLPLFYGGQDQSLTYQVTYGALSAATVFIGGEFGQAGRLGRTGGAVAWTAEHKLGVEVAENVGGKSAGNAGRVFWSGRQGANRAAAEAFAKSTGRVTLEMTPAGQALEVAGGNISQWRELSADFAQGAYGEVHAFVGGSKINSVWNTVEKPILMRNPNVHKIVIKDATQPWKTKVIYK